MTTLEVKDLVVDFRQRHGPDLRAVDHVSFRLEPGRTLALVGESGSGKSTILRTLARLQKPTSGEILLDGERVGRRRDLARYRRLVQLVFQDPFASLNPAHTVGHHLARPLRLHDRVGQEGLDAALAELLGSVNLVPAADMAHKYPHELSGGQRQRVAIARALAPAPAVLLADEPVSMLDVSIRLEILNLLDRLKSERDLAMLYVTHDLATARHFSADIMVLYRGQVVEHGPADAVILHPAHPYTQLLASSAPAPLLGAADREARKKSRAAERAGRGGERHERAAATGCPFRPRCPHAMPVCQKPPPDLPAGMPGHLNRCWLYDPEVMSERREGAPGALRQ